MGMEIYNDEQLKGMLELCIKGGNFTKAKAIKRILDSRNVPYKELLELNETGSPLSKLALCWPSPSD